MEHVSHLSQDPLRALSDCAENVATYFAPAGRDSAEELARKTAAVRTAPFLAEMLNAMPHMVMVLNARRQVVAANEALLRVLGAPADQILGKRPGEAIDCIWADEGPDGCGTARHCVLCGAAEAFLESRRANGQAVRECRVLVKTPSGSAPMDLRVTTTPFQLEGDCLALAVIEDISQVKRLAVLQRTFFHDVLNTAGCIQGYIKFLEHDASNRPDTRQRLAALADQIVAEIQTQRDLLAAEAGDYEVQPVPMQTREMLDELCVRYGGHTASERQSIRVASCWDGTIVSDKQLLLRILGNMLKNALEATSRGGTIALACVDAGSNVTFTVHNAGAMPEEVQLQVFQRSFSTKGESGRGVGTYSMKLFGERYLSGEVSFASSLHEGTIFRLTIPKKLSIAQSQPAERSEA